MSYFSTKVSANTANQNLANKFNNQTKWLLQIKLISYIANFYKGSGTGRGITPLMQTYPSV